MTNYSNSYHIELKPTSSKEILESLPYPSPEARFALLLLSRRLVSSTIMGLLSTLIVAETIAAGIHPLKLATSEPGRVYKPQRVVPHIGIEIQALRV